MADLVIDGQTIEAIVLPNGEELELGKNPTGNIDITQAGVTDVSEYATATVPNATYQNAKNNYFTTVGGRRVWKNDATINITNGGWISYGGYSVVSDIYTAIPTNTHITPTTSAQTIGDTETMLEGAVTVDAVPNAEIGDPTMSGRSISISVSNGGLITASSPAESVSVNLGNVAGYIPNNKNVTIDVGSSSATQQLTTRTSSDLTASGATVSVPSGYYASNASKAVASGTEGTPTATKGTVSNHAVSVTPSVTNSAGYISGGTHSGTAVSVSASELVSGTVNITSSGNTDVANYATASVASGSATPPTTISGSQATLTTGTNTITLQKTVSVTPRVTAGYISSGTAGNVLLSMNANVPTKAAATYSPSATAQTIASGTYLTGAQTIEAAPLQSKTVTENGTVTPDTGYYGLSEVVVNVEGGGGGGVQIGKTTKTTASAASSIQFTGLSGNPTSFAITSADDVATNTDGVTQVIFDGTSLHGQTMTTQVTADTGFTKSYSGGTLTVTATTASFLAGDYKLVYTYGGSASDIETADIQVGSGATSITFPVSGRPAYWSCIFKSDFSTSSGYQRVIGVVNDGSSIYGLEMDSSAHAATSWTATYSGGNLTINSQGTNVGGYFHQPGYYQLTYYVDASAPSYQAKSAYATTTAQTITPDSGYDALESVSIGAISQTNLIAGNIKNGTTISINNGSTNLWSVVGTYTGGGGGGSSIDTKTLTNSNDQATSLEFTGMKGQPIAFFLRCTAQLSRSSSYSYYYITAVRYNGTNTQGNYYRRSNGTYYADTTHYSYTYSGTTLTISSSASRGAAGGSFYSGSYELVYIY